MSLSHTGDSDLGVRILPLLARMVATNVEYLRLRALEWLATYAPSLSQKQLFDYNQLRAGLPTDATTSLETQKSRNARSEHTEALYGR